MWVCKSDESSCAHRLRRRDAVGHLITVPGRRMLPSACEVGGKRRIDVWGSFPSCLGLGLVPTFQKQKKGEKGSALLPPMFESWGRVCNPPLRRLQFQAGAGQKSCFFRSPALLRSDPRCRKLRLVGGSPMARWVCGEAEGSAVLTRLPGFCVAQCVVWVQYQVVQTTVLPGRCGSVHMVWVRVLGGDDCKTKYGSIRK